MKTPKKILVIGGTGLLGQQLVKDLAGTGKQVYILSRTPEKFTGLTALGITMVKGDLIDKPSLIQACQGMDVVIGAAHSLLGKGRYDSPKVDEKGHRDLIDAAKQAGVGYFIYTSIIGVSNESPVGFWRTKMKIENYLKQSGLPYNIVRASAFMELHIRELMGKSIVEKGKVLLFGKGENPVNFVSVRDVASIMMHCLNHPEERNKTFEVGGLDNVSRLEVVRMYEEYLGKKVKVSHVPRGVLKVMSVIMKPFHPGLSRVMFVGQFFDARDESYDVRPLLKEIPLKITRMKDFIRAG